MNHEMSSKILPLQLPLITSYQNYATIFAILANYENAEPWLYSSFVNLWGGIMGTRSQPLRFSPWKVMNVCPFFFSSIIDFPLINSISNSITEFLIKSIFNGYYVVIPCDEYHIPVAPNYQKEHYSHEILVYGYNKDEGMFYAADFFNRRMYSLERISFEDMEIATNSVINIPAPLDYINKDAWNNVQLLRYNNIVHHFDVSLLIKSLKDYVNSEYTLLNSEENTVTDEEREDLIHGNMVFGMENYNLIKRYLDLILNNIVMSTDIRPFHALCDHKILMLARLDYLKKHGYIPMESQLKERYLKVYNLCVKNRHNFIKGILHQKKDLADTIKDTIDLIISEEKPILLDLITELTSSPLSFLSSS